MTYVYFATILQLGRGEDTPLHCDHVLIHTDAKVLHKRVIIEVSLQHLEEGGREGGREEREREMTQVLW